MKILRWIIIGLLLGLYLSVLVACTRRYPGGQNLPFVLPEREAQLASPTEIVPFLPEWIATESAGLPLDGTSPITATGSSTVTLPVVSSGITATLPVTPAVGVTLTLPVIGVGITPEASTGMTVTLPLVSVVVTPTVSLGSAIQAAQSAAAGETLFVLQAGTPAAVQNFTHPEAGCNWAGVIGQAFDQSGAPVAGLVVEVAGILEGKEFLALAITGSSQAVGPGGFEVSLGDHSIASQGTLYVQMFDLQGRPVSRVAPITTYADCNQNTVLVNFLEVPLNRKGYLPYISAGAIP